MAGRRSSLPVERVTHLYQVQGVEVGAIAKRFDVRPSTIVTLLKKAGVYKKRAYRRREAVSQVVRPVAHGKTVIPGVSREDSGVETGGEA